jgi:hypothetical protein
MKTKLLTIKTNYNDFNKLYTPKHQNTATGWII